jgi:drug/metabolite transporter (DMT)-like permease
MALGEISALGDAACWAGVGVTTKRLSRRVRPIHLSAFLATVSTSALLVISAATGKMDDVLRTPVWALSLFIFGAAVGSAGMLTFFITISRGSVGATYTTTSGLYILFSMLGGVLLLDDRAGPWTIAGAVAIMAGLYVLNSQPVRSEPPAGGADGATAGPDAGPGQRPGPGFLLRASLLNPAAGRAVGLAALTAFLWSVDLIASAKGLEGADLLTNGLVHQAVPALVFGGYILVTPVLREGWPARADRPRLALAGCLYTGSTLTWNYALANADAGVTALLASTSPAFALTFAGVILRERLPRAALIGAAVAFAGTVTVVGSR